MSDNAVELERLETLARLLIQNPEQTSVVRQFTDLLQSMTDRVSIHEFAVRFRPHPEVSIPMYKRLLELSPDSPELILELGSVYYMCGDDQNAALCAEQVRSLCGETVDGLTLEAALTRDPDKKKKLFTRIVMIDPKNRMAFDNLIMLRKP